MNKEKHDCFDVTIIGGGPTGLFAAFYAGMRELKTKIIEGTPALGGKLPYYRDKYLYDVGGVAAISGGDLVKELEAQATTFKPNIVLSQLIEQMERLSDGTFRLTSSTGETHITRTILLATGGATPVPTKLNLPGVEQFEDKALHYWVGDTNRFRGKRVLISGGGDSAVDYANLIAPIAEYVGIVHRRNEFRAHEGYVTTMKDANVDVMTPCKLQEIHGNDGYIDSVTIKQLETDETFNVPIDEIMVCHGSRHDLGGIKHWGLEIENDRIIVDAWMQTSISGIFAAGDAVEYKGKLPGLIAGGFMEGPAAINRVKLYLQPDSDLMPIWSTYHEELLSIHGHS